MKESDYGYDDDYDDMESTLLGENPGGVNMKAAGGNLESKINLSTRVENDIRSSEKKGEKRANYYGRDDRATSEQVMDPRTRMILFKLLNSKYLSEINGCLSTGKEANVYYAKGGNGEEYAVKIFKTSILVFKDRDRYVSGEYRFRHGYCKSNPRKMVRTWAEKEMRNLKRLTVAGIPCPEPHLLKQHVLIMDFLGEDGWCAPRLREVSLSLEELTTAYASIVKDMRRMYHECNLVHGDLSEYNLLWHRGRAVIIDVSQSVENAHPMANDFLRMDINNINDYFKKRDVQTLSNFRLFQFITSTKLLSSLTLEHDVMMEELSLKLTEMLAEQEVEDDRCLDEDEENEEEVANAVFLQSYIPSSLSEINNPQAENEKLKHGGQREKIFEMAVHRMLGSEDSQVGGEGTSGPETDANGVSRLPNAVEQMKLQSMEEDDDSVSNGSGDEGLSNDDMDINDDDDDDIEEEDERDEDGNFIHKKKKSSKYRRRLTDKSNEEERIQQKEAKKEAKKVAKEQAALKRTKKIPKHVKKRATKKDKK
mmetsp:Transcript_11478/g.18732  ORF Transcript_11478/g.18732 Transcript_11478/m.18732 type:complete len:537 (-) Transcript_11478:120-1730(-)